MKLYYKTLADVTSLWMLEVTNAMHYARAYFWLKLNIYIGKILDINKI